MEKKLVFNFLYISLIIVIFSSMNCKRDRVNPLDPENPNSDAVALPPPTGLTVTPDYGAVILKWDSVGEASAYQICRDDEQITRVDTNYYEDTGLTSGQKYKYQVASVHSSGLGGHKSDPVYGTPIKGARIEYSKYEISSDSNGNGNVNPGELINMWIYLKNTGTDKALGVSAVLSTNDTHITISYDSTYYYDLDPNEEYKGNFYYIFSVPTTCPYGHVVTFYLNISDNDGNSWADTFSITVEKTEANIIYSKYEIWYDSNDNGNVNPGEVIKMWIYLKNTGTDKAMGVRAVMSTNDAYITISYDDAYYYDLDPNEEYKGDDYYWFSVSSSCPHSHTITFDLDIDDEDGNSWSDSFTVPVE